MKRLRGDRTATADGLLALFGFDPEEADETARGGALVLGEFVLSQIPQ